MHSESRFLSAGNLNLDDAFDFGGTELQASQTEQGRAGAATKRINARFPTGLAEKIEYAASLPVIAVAAFIQERPVVIWKRG